MALDDMDRDTNDVEETSPPEESSNRPFFIVAGILGAIMLLSLICLAVYALLIAPGRRNQQATQAAQVNAQNTQIAFAAQQTAEAASWTATPTITPTPIPPTATPSRTPVVAAPTQVVGTTTADILTATVSALQTQLAEAQQSPTPSPSALPSTGFADNIGGVPGLVGLGLALIVVIFLARRLRTAS
jgi:hypothetical protein